MSDYAEAALGYELVRAERDTLRKENAILRGKCDLLAHLLGVRALLLQEQGAQLARLEEALAAAIRARGSHE